MGGTGNFYAIWCVASPYQVGRDFGLFDFL